MKKLSFEKANRIYQDLYGKAVNRYCEKTDWDITEWLDDNELKEYEKAKKVIYGY